MYLFLLSIALQIGSIIFEFFLSMILLYYLLAFTFGGLVTIQFFLLKEVENYQFPRIRKRLRICNFVAFLWSVGLMFGPLIGIECRDNHPFSLAMNVMILSYILLFTYFCVLIYKDLFTYSYAVPDLDKQKAQSSRTLKSIHIQETDESSE